MHARPKRSACLFSLIVVGLLTLSASNVRADLNAKQARKAITRMAGFELTNGAVKVKSVSPTGPTTAEATALVRSVFRFEKDAQGIWRVAEIRWLPTSGKLLVDCESLKRQQGRTMQAAESTNSRDRG